MGVEKHGVKKTSNVLRDKVAVQRFLRSLEKDNCWAIWFYNTFYLYQTYYPYRGIKADRLETEGKYVRKLFPYEIYFEKKEIKSFETFSIELELNELNTLTVRVIGWSIDMDEERWKSKILVVFSHPPGW